MTSTTTPEEELLQQVNKLRSECRVSYALSVVFLLSATILGWVVSAWAIAPAHKEAHPAGADVPVDEKAIRTVLDAQVVAWNKGDIDGFMKGYWKDEKLTFISGDKITQGWEATRERYIKRYQADGKDKMGVLSFDELHFEGFGPDSAMARGRFKLVRGEQIDTGRFTLLFRKTPDGWRIVHDHTSVGEKPAEKKDKPEKKSGER